MKRSRFSKNDGNNAYLPRTCVDKSIIVGLEELKKVHNISKADSTRAVMMVGMINMVTDPEYAAEIIKQIKGENDEDV
jgi:hypothetical protein